MKSYFKFLIAFLLFSFQLFAQEYSGPEKGVVPTGKIISTDNFTASPLNVSTEFRLIEHKIPKPIDEVENDGIPAAPLGSNLIKDYSHPDLLNNATDSVIIFKDFQGLLHENSIPPDPYIAVGPEHIMLVVNSYFRITDKKGNVLITISASQWYGRVLPGASVFDPKVIYDPYGKRWVMVWLHANDKSSESYFMLSVSDDSNPLGNWFVWAVPANVYGSTPSGSWADYEGIGFDDKAIYLTSNQFTFSDGTYDGTRIRILPKSEIYVSDSASSFSYTDIWNVKYPGTTYGAFGLRPVRMYSKEDSYYFVKHSPYVTGTQVAVYELIDPLGETPTLVSYKIPVTAYNSPPNANQLGGGEPLIEGGGAGFRNEPVYKDGIIYIVHSVEFQQNGRYSGIHFVALDLFSQKAKVDFVFGSEHHYYIYPALALDANNDVFISYSRSGDYEYCGAYFTVVPSGQSVPTGSLTIQPGKAHYIVTYGGSRNRWGDYSGAWQDPADTNNVWMFAEYVDHTDRWGTWAAGARFVPFENQFAYVNKKNIDFGEYEIGKGNVEKQVVVKNYGNQSLNVNSVSVNDAQLSLSTFPSLPVQLNAYDSVVVGITFTPQTPGFIKDSLKVETNDSDNPEMFVKIKARAFEIAPADLNKLYACTTSTTQPSKLLLLDETNGQATEIGDVEYVNVSSLTVNPESNEIFGLIKTTDYSQILKLNAAGGDGHYVMDLPTVFSAISFYSGSAFYGVTTEKKLYSIAYPSLDTTFVMDLPAIPLTLAYNSFDGTLWFSTRTGIRTGKIYKIDLNSKSVKEVASLDVLVNDMCFDDSGDLFALYGSSTYLTVIDTATGVNYDIGKTGKIRVKGLAIKGDITVSAVGNDNSDVTPVDFQLAQNHPNPFNPSTKISFTVPVKADVELSVYNLLGQKIVTLAKGEMNAGSYEVNFNASNLGSGTYFYKIVAKGSNGKIYQDVKKMVLLK